MKRGDDFFKNRGIVTFKFNKNIGLKTFLTLSENTKMLFSILENSTFLNWIIFILCIQNRLMKRRHLIDNVKCSTELG